MRKPRPIKLLYFGQLIFLKPDCLNVREVDRVIKQLKKFRAYLKWSVKTK